MRLNQCHSMDLQVPTRSQSSRRLPPTEPRCSSRNRWIALAATVLALTVAQAPPVHAQGTRGASAAYGAQAHVRLVPFSGSTDTLSVDPVAASAAQAPPHFLLSNSESSLDTALGEMGKLLCTSSLTSAVSGTVDLSQIVSSRAEVDEVELLIVGTTPLFTLSALDVLAEASMSGPCGDALAGSGSATITGAVLGGELGSGLTVPSNPNPNTVLLDQDGLRVVLNERQLIGSGFGDLRLAVNAIHVVLDEVLVPGVGLLYGEIIVGHAEAELVCGDEL